MSTISLVSRTTLVGITNQSDTPPRAPADEVDALVEVCFAVHGMLSAIAAAHDLSVTQLRLLGVLRDREPGIQQLAEHLGLEKSSVSGLIDRAEARRLVRRAASATDGRAVRVAMTAEGRTLAATVEREVASAVAELAAPLTGPQRTRLTALLRRMVPEA